MTIPTFAPSRNPSFPVNTLHAIREDRQRTSKGYDIGRPMGVRPLRRLPLEWLGLSLNQLHEILSFFYGLNGSTGPFFWSPTDKVISPNGVVPVLGQVAGGSLTGQGTYFVKFTWYNTASAQETLPSKEASFSVSDNFLLTVDVPVFQMGVTEWRVYVGSSSGDNQLQAGTETERRWTMPASGPIAGAQPPTENTLALPLLWKLDGDLEEQKSQANRFRLRATFQEQTAL